MRSPIVISIIACVGMVVIAIIAVNYINRDRVHVPSEDEIFVTACVKRGGNPVTKIGNDYTGDKSVRIEERNCEGVK